MESFVRTARQLCCLAAALGAGCRSVPTPLGAKPDVPSLVAPFLFDRPGSRRADTSVTWMAADTAAWRALREVARTRDIALEPPTTSPVLCPGSTDANGRQLRDRIGYVVGLRAWETDSIPIVVDAQISCRYVSRGEPRGFRQGRVWAAEKIRGGYRLLRILDDYIT